MKLFPIVAENFKIDGGACFGVVPKTIWERYIKADENNMIPLASRCLLADTGDKRILVDVGMGNKQSDKFFGFYHPFGDDTLKGNLAKYGYTPEDITDVILTHLHFDHVGGAVRWASDGKTPELVFPNANVYCTQSQWENALNANPREKASYFEENLLPLKESGRLHFIDQEGGFCPGVDLEIKHGHTVGQIVPIFTVQGKKLAYMADFIAAIGNIPLAYIPSFDMDPSLSMKEKEEFLNRAVKNDYTLMFEHDFENECCNLQVTPKGVREKEIFPLETFTKSLEL